MLGELFRDHVDLVLYGVPSRFGPRQVNVVLMPQQPDGQMTWSGIQFLFIGTQPLPLMEDVRREGRRVVRRGLQDVLEWLGEDWNDEPSGAEIFDALKNGTDPMKVTNKHIRAM